MSFFERILLLLEPMTATGNDVVGWSAKYKNDPNWCRAAKQETAIFACKQRRNEVLSGKIIRGKDGYYSA